MVTGPESRRTGWERKGREGDGTKSLSRGTIHILTKNYFTQNFQNFTH